MQRGVPAVPGSLLCAWLAPLSAPLIHRLVPLSSSFDFLPLKKPFHFIFLKELICKRNETFIYYDDDDDGDDDYDCFCNFPYFLSFMLKVIFKVVRNRLARRHVFPFFSLFVVRPGFHVRS